MPAIIFSGQVYDAAGSALLLIVSNSNGIVINETRVSSYSLTVPLEPGEYVVFVGAFSKGSFVFDVQGDYRHISPEVPDDFGDKRKEAYILLV